MNGFIFYDGPSALDGKPILGIAVGLHTRHTNQKTGAMVQTYILRKDLSPTVALQTGEDVSVCGDCIHRELKSCYVRVDNGPLIVWKASQRGIYPRVSHKQAAETLKGRTVRLGTYGDPAAIPFAVWSNILRYVTEWTGYTHQWKRPEFSEFKRYCMASADNKEEYNRARANGWRAFYVLPKHSEEKPDGAFLCPASEEGGKKLTCIDCTACNGTLGQGHASVYIPVHGIAYKQTRFAELIQIGR